MSTHRTACLATLRKRRRSIALLLLPALALWAMSGSACLAMLAAATPVQQQTEHPADAPVGHHAAAQHETHDAAPAPADCPHCPPGHHTADFAHGSCSAAGDSASGKAPQKDDSAAATPLVAIAGWAARSTSAVPPLITPVAPDPAQLRAPVPIRIRHCVFRI